MKKTVTCEKCGRPLDYNVKKATFFTVIATVKPCTYCLIERELVTVKNIIVMLEAGGTLEGLKAEVAYLSAALTVNP